MKIIAKVVALLGLTAMGMAGLYYKIEYSGWVLAAGAYIAFFCMDDK